MKTDFEQPKKLSRKELMDSCCQQVASKISKKEISSWTNSDYVQLSSFIKKKTKIHLNENTLKRIFGKLKTPEDYAPQKATLDALAQFLDYRDWYEFEFSQKSQLLPAHTKSVTAETNPTGTKISANKWLIFIITIFIVGATSALLYKGDFSLGPTTASLLCINPEGTTPHSALFTVKSPSDIDFDDNNLIIDFADHRKKRVVYSDSIMSHYYEIPGRFFPKLLLNNKVIDTASVYAKTNGWVAVAEIWNDTLRVFPVSNQIALTNALAYVGVNEVYNAGIDTNKTFLVNFCNVKPSNVSGDNFQLTTTVITSVNRPGVRCSQLDVTIFGEKDTHFLNLIKPECVSWSSYKFSEKFKNGDKSDLRSLGIDLTDGGELKLTITDKKVVLGVNGKIILRTAYQKAIGKVMGLKIAFAGIGTFSNLKLTDLKTGAGFE